jgi:hypothetical protein
MVRRSAIPRLVAVALCFYVTVAAGAAPPSIASLASATSLSESQQSVIDDYARHWSGIMLTGKDEPDQLRKAQRELIEPLRRGGVSELFRDHYGRALLPTLATVIDESSGQACVSSYLIVSKIGTERALDLMLDRSSIKSEPRRYSRLAAARGCKQLLADADLSRSNLKKNILTASRRLLAAAKVEPDQYALRYQLEALLAAHRATKVPAQQAQVRAHVIDALRTIADRARKGGPTAGLELIDAAYPVLFELKKAFLDPEALPAVQREFARDIGPCLVDLLEVGEAHWKAIQSEPRTKDCFGKVVRFIENFVRTINPFVGPDRASLDTGLFPAWQNDEPDVYKQDIKLMRDALGK